MMISSASSAMRVLDGFDPEYFGLIYDPGNTCLSNCAA